MTTAYASGLKPTEATNVVLADSWCVHGTIADGLVQIDVTVADLDVETAFRVGACPCFVVDCCALASKV
jgi:hypothetical protein